jgi:chromosome segregation ATPase
MKEFLSEQLPAIITGILGVGAYVFERRRKNAEIQTVESNALSSMQDAYAKFTEDFRKKFEDMQAELELARKEAAQGRIEVQNIQSELELARKEVMQSRVEVQELKKEIEEWQAKYERVLRELKSIQNDEV